MFCVLPPRPFYINPPIPFRSHLLPFPSPALSFTPSFTPSFPPSLFPPLFPSPAQDCINLPHFHRSAERLHYLRYEYSLQPLAVRHTDDHVSLTALPSQWEPLHDFYEAKARSEWAADYFRTRQVMLRHTLQELEEVEGMAHFLRWRQLEWSHMECEDARASLHRTNRLLTHATNRIDSAMAQSRENLEDIEMQEQNVWENWKQSWDVLEDGNGWMGLNNRRKYLRVNRFHEEEYIAAAG